MIINTVSIKPYRALFGHCDGLRAVSGWGIPHIDTPIRLIEICCENTRNVWRVMPDLPLLDVLFVVGSVSSILGLLIAVRRRHRPGGRRKWKISFESE